MISNGENSFTREGLVIPPLCEAPEKATAIPSKSELHRLMIAAALSDENVSVECARSMRSEDIDATADCLRALGARIDFTENTVEIQPIRELPEKALLHCRESGSTLRFMLPVAGALGVNAEIAGQGRLPNRPLDDLARALKEHGMEFSSDTLPFKISGKLTSGTYTLPGNVSSQYVTGLLLALATLDGESEIRLTSPLQSAAYVDITCDALAKFGVTVEKSENAYKISGKKLHANGLVRASGDWSNASYFLASGALFKPVTLENLDLLSSQGDMKILEILSDFGADIVISNGNVTVSPNERHSISVDLTQIPDLLPTLATLAMFAEGESSFYGGERLRLKESDRIKSVCDMINSLGGKAIEEENGLRVLPQMPRGGEISSHGDHRIVMAASLASLGCSEEVTIVGTDAVKKSYPSFFEEFFGIYKA